jgi:23S rRNA (cytosine1962-C5)-methyltransferase
VSASAPADAVLNRQGLARWRTGHPWIYRAGVAEVEEETGREPVTRVLDPRGQLLGHALLSRESQITLRRLSEGDAEPDAGFFSDRIAAAVAYRNAVLPGRDAVRVVHGESDGLPGLVADRYGDHLVVQLLTWGADALRDEWIRIFAEVLNPASILARNDPAVRGLEGLPRVVEVLHGSPPDDASYHEGQLRFTANLRTGQKTGAFLDQVENHLRTGMLARGHVLDAFAYSGGFGLAAAARAEHVTLVDSSTEALDRARRHAEQNEIGNVTFTEANAFDLLRRLDRDGDRFDMVILDPPAFAKNKRELDGALRGYKEINLRAMKLLRPGGILVTCSCSYHLSDALMDEVLARAAADARRGFRVRERRDQTPDHPVRVGFPESSYLKCRILEFSE